MGVVLALAGFLAAAPSQATDTFQFDSSVRAAVDANTTVAAYQAFVWRAFQDIEPYYQRSDWGAAPRRGDPTRHYPLIATIHHTDTPAKFDAEDAKKAVRGFQYYHMFGRALEKLDNFDDIGYHFLIDGQGRIFEGRPMDTLGAHARGGNYANVGIALIGNFENDAPSAKQIESTLRLLTYLAALYRVSETYQFINAHNDFVKSTSCPGKNLLALLPSLRKQVDERLRRLRPKSASK